MKKVNNKGEGIIGIIPARWDSSRFPGKPLIQLHGRPMVVHVCDRAARVLDRIWVATDDERIQKTVEQYGYHVVMTSKTHTSGTSRCFEAGSLIAASEEKAITGVINIQGDEPLINPQDLIRLKEVLLQHDPDIVTLVKREFDPEVFHNPNRVKVVTGTDAHALCFSRSPLPYFSNPNRITTDGFLIHIGIYGYPLDTLRAITSLAPTLLEEAESLEQLRWLENGYPIRCLLTDYSGTGIDSPEDVAEVLRRWSAASG